MGDEGALKDVLLDEYRFMQKAYELQFTHFMGVFYLWIPLVTLPVGAGVIVNLGSRPLPHGFLLLFVAAMGALLSAKMFDIRRSQVRYLVRANRIREALWRQYHVQEATGIEPLGKGADLLKIVRTDFGLAMAVTMSSVHGLLTGVGIWNLLGLILCPAFTLVLAVVCGLTIACLNTGLFFGMLGHETKVK